MRIPSCRAWARQTLLAITAWSLPAAVFAAADEGTPLTLERVLQLAVEQQPLLAAQAAAVTASRERAVAVGELPDPQLTLGVQDLPLNGAEAGSLRRDSDTMLMLGVSQAFPRGEKRRLAAALETRVADAGEAERRALARQIRRDAGLAFLDVYYADRAVELVGRMLAEAERERAAAEIAFQTARATQADVLAAELAVELLRDRQAAFRQAAVAARAALSRWIGSAAQRASAAELPAVAEPPPLPVILAALPRHPEFLAAAARADGAAAALALAKQRYKPDWSLEARLGYRAEYSEMATVMVGIDVPLFPAERQDREVAAGRAELTRAEALRTDTARRLAAEAERLFAERDAQAQRLRRYDSVIVPASRARVEAALAAYRAGRDSLTALLEARRDALDVALMRLETAVTLARHALGLDYFIAGE
ncbi:MAG TPA: TolC family protein [Gammaproteobacteria bacterium]|nr:TolC family protein [Gammaproteobacteria bacterium]